MSTAPSAPWPFDPQRAEPAVPAGAVRWREVVAEQPDLAAAVSARFDAAKHHVLATLRADGSPRVSGTEVIVGDDWTIGSMWQAVKAKDLLADGRFALHANPGDGDMVGGDAKVSGVASPITGALAAAVAGGLPQEVPEPYHLFRLDLTQVVLSEVDHDRNVMIIRSWRPGKGLVTTER